VQLSEAPACLIDVVASATANELDATTIQLSWNYTAGSSGHLSDLLLSASSVSTLLPSGELAMKNVVDNYSVFNATEVQISTDASTVYWTLTSVGCGGTQHMVTAPLEAKPRGQVN
jgi:hypothetical protein